MRFIVRFGFLLAILGALFWGDVVAFLKLSEAKRPAAAQQSDEVPESSGPADDVREQARREYERLRRENLAEAEAEARRRAHENAVADREDELEQLREAQEEPEDMPPPQRRPPPRSGRR